MTNNNPINLISNNRPRSKLHGIPEGIRVLESDDYVGVISSVPLLAGLRAGIHPRGKAARYSARNNKMSAISNEVSPILKVVVRDRAGALFEGEAEAVSSHNDKGPFDILPLHTNFISIIHKGVVLHLKDKVVKDLSFATGVLKVAENKVEVYLGILH